MKNIHLCGKNQDFLFQATDASYINSKPISQSGVQETSPDDINKISRSSSASGTARHHPTTTKKLFSMHALLILVSYHGKKETSIVET
jgi:hypothetical protein